MSKKSDIRICRYCDCPYNHKIDISTDNYTVDGSKSYYHSDCFKKKCTADELAEKQKEEQRQKRYEKRHLRELEQEERTNKKKKKIEKDEKTKADLQYIKNGWCIHISKTVPYSQLMKCLNDLIARGISSDYLVFTFDYVVIHKLNLNYPAGFQYFVDKKEIKVAYKKHQIKNSGAKKPNDFTAIDSVDTPKFTLKQKPIGFKSILGGDKK